MLLLPHVSAKARPFGGHAVLECDDPSPIRRWTTVLALLEFRFEPVLDVTDAVVAEGSALEGREELG